MATMPEIRLGQCVACGTLFPAGGIHNCTVGPFSYPPVPRDENAVKDAVAAVCDRWTHAERLIAYAYLNRAHGCSMANIDDAIRKALKDG